MATVIATGWTLDYLRSLPLKQYRMFTQFGTLQYQIMLIDKIDRSGTKSGSSGGGWVSQMQGQNAQTMYQKIQFNA